MLEKQTLGISKMSILPTRSSGSQQHSSSAQTQLLHRCEMDLLENIQASATTPSHCASITSGGCRWKGKEVTSCSNPHAQGREKSTHTSTVAAILTSAASIHSLAWFFWFCLRCLGRAHVVCWAEQIHLRLTPGSRHYQMGEEKGASQNCNWCQ